MLKMTPLIALVFMLPCKAEDYLRSSVDWLKSSLPDTKIEFNKERIRFDGCNQKEYQLVVTQPLTDSLSLNGGLSYARGKLDFGIFQQDIQVRRVSLVPTLTTSQNVSFGLGVMLQSEPQFRDSNGFSFDLPASQMMMFETRLQDNNKRHQLLIRLSSQRWDSSDINGNWFERGLADNKLSLRYEAEF